MKPVTVVQQVPHEALGTLTTVLADAGLDVRTIELFRETSEDLQLESAAGLIVLGGPMNVDETDRYAGSAAVRRNVSEERLR
jgi:GMP synthase-like glutamine amidotransferase